MEFDPALQKLDERFGLLADPLIEQLALHEDEKQLAFRRGPLVFVFNFHPHQSYDGLRVPVPERKDYRPVLDTDGLAFEGFGRTSQDVVFPVQNVPMYGRSQSIQVYLPNRSALVLAPV